MISWRGNQNNDSEDGNGYLVELWIDGRRKIATASTYEEAEELEKNMMEEE